MDWQIQKHLKNTEQEERRLEENSNPFSLYSLFPTRGSKGFWPNPSSPLYNFKVENIELKNMNMPFFK